jgi:hypothetical protein
LAGGLGAQHPYNTYQDKIKRVEILRSRTASNVEKKREFPAKAQRRKEEQAGSKQHSTP